MSAVAGVFVAFTTVNSRSVARIVIEVPIEQADAALAALGGFPKPAESRWVGIAPLVAEPAAAAPEPAPEPPAEKVTRIDGRRIGPWRTLSRAQRAGIRCNDAEFQAFCGASDADLAAAYVRQRCGVTTRADLDTNFGGGHRWDDLDAEFREWKGSREMEARYGSLRR
jgi:hypothetical protein